jgi:hypothetical protein
MVFEKEDLEIPDSVEFSIRHFSSFNNEKIISTLQDASLIIYSRNSNESKWVEKYNESQESENYNPFDKVVMSDFYRDGFIYYGYSWGADVIGQYSISNSTYENITIKNLGNIWSISSYNDDVIFQDAEITYKLNTTTLRVDTLLNLEGAPILPFDVSLNDNHYLITSWSDNTPFLNLREKSSEEWKRIATPKDRIIRNAIGTDDDFILSGSMTEDGNDIYYIYRYIPDGNVFVPGIEETDPGFYFERIIHVEDATYIALGHRKAYYITFDSGKSWYYSEYHTDDASVMGATISGNDIYVAFQNGTVWKQDYLTTVEEDQDNSSKTVDDILYYDLVGKQLDPELIPTGQYYIKHTRYTDGSVSTDKLIKWE